MSSSGYRRLKIKRNGNSAVPQTDRIEIKYMHMNAAYVRDNGRNLFRDITIDWENECVHFYEDSFNSGHTKMHVNAAIFGQCGQSDDQCIQSHLQLYGS